MNAARHFLDTNILVYTFDLTSPQKARRAEDLVHNALASGNGIISYQVAQEFIRRAGMRRSDGHVQAGRELLAIQVPAAQCHLVAAPVPSAASHTRSAPAVAVDGAVAWGAPEPAS